MSVELPLPFVLFFTMSGITSGSDEKGALVSDNDGCHVDEF